MLRMADQKDGKKQNKYWDPPGVTESILPMPTSGLFIMVK